MYVQNSIVNYRGKWEFQNLSNEKLWRFLELFFFFVDYNVNKVLLDGFFVSDFRWNDFGVFVNQFSLNNKKKKNCNCCVYSENQIKQFVLSGMSLFPFNQFLINFYWFKSSVKCWWKKKLAHSIFFSKPFK